MKKTGDLLTKTQARHVRICLERLRAETEELVEWLAGLPEPQADWVRDVRAELDALLRAVRDASAELGLDLQTRAIEPRRRVAAWAGLWWAGVLDCRPAALRAYGPVDPRIEQILDPLVERLATRLRRIGALAEPARPGDGR